MATPRRDENTQGVPERPHAAAETTDRQGTHGPWVDGRRTARRLAGLGATTVVAVLTLTACIGEEDRPYTTIDPQTEVADDIQGLYKLTFWLGVVVFIGVQFLIFYTALRFRQKRRLANRPEQIHGNTRLEITWTIVPAVVLLIIFVFTVPVMYDTAANADDEDGALIVEAYGKQWWWEFHYPGKGPNGEPLITANEVRVPAGQKVIFKLISNNVIHSFWVPQLAGKEDIMPGYETKIAFTPEIPGEYFGECAELCGTQHAWMRFKVIVEPKEQFDAWVAAWNAGPQGDLAQAPVAFANCLQCHRANNTFLGETPLNIAPVGYDAPYNMGPNLTLFGCRETLGAGILVNNQENVEAWLRDPHDIKEGNLMGYAIGPEGEVAELAPEQATELATWLLSLRLPDGSCPTTGTTPPPPAASPVAVVPAE